MFSSQLVTLSDAKKREMSHGAFYIIRKDMPITLLLVFLSCAIGALLRTVLRETTVPILVMIFFIGVATGLIDQLLHKLPFVNHIAEIDPILFLHLFTPVIIFTAAFEMDFYIFRKSFWQVLILAVPGFLINCAFLGWIIYKINRANWSWDDSMLFGIVLSTTDPVLSVASVRNIGFSKLVINLIIGESLFNNATTAIVFELYSDLISQPHQEVVREIFLKLMIKIFASALFGFLSSKLVSYWLVKVFNDAVIEVILSFSMAYITFFVAEWLGMSGVIALCMLGLLLDSVSFSPGMDVFLFRFWSMLTFLAHIMIYLIMGIVIAKKPLQNITHRIFFTFATVYLSMNLVRALVILTLSPFLSRLGYGFNWHWGAVIVWSGIKGTFTLNIALRISHDQNASSTELQIKTMMLMHSGAVSLLTLIINSTTVKKLVMTLGLCKISLPKRMAMYNAVERIRNMKANVFSMLKLDRFLADANWAMAEDAVTIDYPYKLDSEEDNQLNQTFKCPECNADITYERSSQQIADIMEEARLRLLTAQIASYQKQYNSGMLNQEATQTLIDAVESYVDIEGKFMNIHEVKTYWESKGLLVRMKNNLSDWVYNVKDETSKAPKNKFLRLCHQLVFIEEFEYISCLVTYLNCMPIIFHFIPAVSTEFLPQLRICNYYFLSLYILEAFVKAFAMGRAYIYYHWNQFDILIIILGIIDVIVVDIFEKTDSSYPMVDIIRILRFVRVLRVLRLLKLVIPKIISILEKQINKQLTFQYDIAKGYVQGEEDTKCLIRQIAGHERVYIEISKILQKNKQEAMKELGLMQRDYPDIVTAVKTKHAVQTVLNIAADTLKFMISGGIVDKNEGAKLQKIILVKKKQLATLPSTIAPPTVQELLHNVTWLYNNKSQIEYIENKTKILYYDYGDIIYDESDLPQGIHLIVSGMVKLSGSPPRYGVDKDIYREAPRNPVISYTDYLVTGAIIGELNCLTKQEMEYAVTCETAVQACFISIDDLLEAFDTFLEEPSLEYKIWLKIALDVALKTFKENPPSQDWPYKMCAQFSNMYVLDVPNHTKFDIYDGTMDDIILVHGTVQDCQLGHRYYAPYILPKTCHQVQSTSSVTKLLVIQSKDHDARKSTGTWNTLCEYHSIRRSAATLGEFHPLRISAVSSMATDFSGSFLSHRSSFTRQDFSSH